MPAATNPKIIIGDIQFAALDIVAKPLAAINEIKLPNINTIIIQVNPLGKVSVSFGIFILNGIPTAVAETVIMAPARKQKRMPLARL